MIISQLIEKLQGLDPGLEVLTSDIANGDFAKLLDEDIVVLNVITAAVSGCEIYEFASESLAGAHKAVVIG
ncbi:hypothetical protein ASG42_25255 [Rhizobium sp. Leaf391]|uniref:hypothetical protein n=1 Tax=Rhizobium sp. Leaf391 TaxID=1736360 RepID=UPI0007149C91|nr:hypothetical protein [Rhizobium sp. Leaf391]KQT02807.1 hypothetical protein ASG42_25255 [Rhizobium sp. Leaf391]